MLSKLGEKKMFTKLTSGHLRKLVFLFYPNSIYIKKQFFISKIFNFFIANVYQNICFVILMF